MILDVLDRKVRSAFSNAAVQYDVLASLHREIGRDLTKRLRQLDVNGPILDVGMGTGWFTNRMKHFFPECDVTGIDFSSGMIEQSLERDEAFNRVIADANNIPFAGGVFSLLTSNLAYQWVSDLSSAFTECHRVLKPDGSLSMTMFGFNTFQEVFSALEAAKGSSSIDVRRLASVKDIESALNTAGFKSIKVDYEQVRVRYPDMISILKWIKDIGANASTKKFFIGKDLLARANEYYMQTYCDRLGIYTTFEIIWLEGKK